MKLDYLLTPEHRRQGLHLEDDEDRVYLYTELEGIRIWPWTVRLPEILAEADRWLKSDRQQKADWRVLLK